jgi:hypothetical protein
LGVGIQGKSRKNRVFKLQTIKSTISMSHLQKVGKIGSSNFKVVLAGCTRKKPSHGTPSSFESHTDDKASSGIPDGLRSFLVPDREKHRWHRDTCPQRGQDLKGRRGAPMPPRTAIMPWGQTIHTQGANYCIHRKSPKRFWCPHVIILFVVRYVYSKPKGSEILH